MRRFFIDHLFYLSLISFENIVAQHSALEMFASHVSGMPFGLYAGAGKEAGDLPAMEKNNKIQDAIVIAIIRLISLGPVTIVFLKLRLIK